jgi:asparagine synthetase B (glutamine-hydrolysing)
VLAGAVAGVARRDGIAALWRTAEFRRIGSHLLGRTRRPSFRLGLLRPDLGHAIGERLLEEQQHYRRFLRPAQAELLLGAGAAFDSHGEDWYANAHGIEFRMPFRDLALVRFCLSIPADLSLRDGERKWLLRQALRGRLPEHLRQRPKGSDLTPFQDAASARQQARHARLRAPASAWVDGLLDTSACARLDPDERAILDWMSLALGAWLGRDQ